jgi:hypothetical protein
MTLPASPQARRRELAIREEVRREALDRLSAIDRLSLMERKLDALLNKEAGEKSPVTPNAPLDPREARENATSTERSRILSLARAIANEDIYVPGYITHAFDDDGETIAASITYPDRNSGLTWTIAEAVATGLLVETRGGPFGVNSMWTFNHHKAAKIVHAVRTAENPADWRFAASAPGRPRL